MKKEKDEKLEQIKGTIFCTYFIASCVSLFIINNENLPPFIFGQLFFVSAMIFLSDTDKSNLPVLAHLTIGLACMYLPIFLKIPKEIFSDLSIDNYIAIALFGLFIILGYVFIIVHKFTINKKAQIFLYVGSWIAYLMSLVVLLNFSWHFLF